MKHFISIIIPNYNGSQTIGKCLESIFTCSDDDREVIVVDDCSNDDSVDIIRKYPCKLIRLEQHAGASAARNAGASNSKGTILFFIDADCLLQENTLSIVRKNLAEHPPDVVIGGTYTPAPHDPGFFSLFQSVFIHYSETKNSGNPDYLATHALVIHTETFEHIGGFTENFLPIIEDVEFCHRLRRAGYRLVMDPDLQVRHIFNLSFVKSLRNAVRKTRYWTEYSLGNRDLFADSGAASREIKIQGVTWLVTVLLTPLFLVSGDRGFLMPLPLLWGASIFANRHLFSAFIKKGSASFALMAGVYYTMVYPAAVWTGFFRGVIRRLIMNKKQPPQGDPRRPSPRGSAKE